LPELFGKSDYIESQHFNKLHRLPIGLDHDDLETTLREGNFDAAHTNSHRRTPLYWAASRGDFAKVSLVLDYGAPPNAGLSVITGVVHHFQFEKDSLGFTDYSRLAIAKMLVEAGG
jgi:ankyrin repeat protein